MRDTDLTDFAIFVKKTCADQEFFVVSKYDCPRIFRTVIAR